MNIFLEDIVESIVSRNEMARPDNHTVRRRFVAEEIADQLDLIRPDASANVDQYERIRWLGLANVYK